MANLDGKSEKIVRAEINVAENSRLLAVAIAVFVVTFIYHENIPSFLFAWTVGQLVLSLPLFYKSSDGYEKLAYRDYPKWKWFAKILNTSATALEFNAIGLLVYIFSLEFAILFFGFTWAIELVYAILDIKEKRENLRKRFFKSVFFVLLQVIFGFGIMLLYHFSL
ncbi:MAG: hypothetical protein EU536_03860 [Promethearchaeota archaeon]|nr:MAG: hypothetical protein EU536_03860 [Candidatus Lokiarchaeota archaeon]